VAQLHGAGVALEGEPHIGGPPVAAGD
jgi:hypothetical protein